MTKSFHILSILIHQSSLTFNAYSPSLRQCPKINYHPIRLFRIMFCFNDTHVPFETPRNLIGGGSRNHVQQHPHSSTLNGSLFVGGSCGTDVDGLPNYVTVLQTAWRHLTPPPTHPRNRSSPGREGKPTRLLYRLQKDSLRASLLFCFDHATTLALWTGRGNTFGDIEDCAPYCFFQPPLAHADELSVHWPGAYWPSGVRWKRAVNSKRSLGAYWFSDVSWKRTDNFVRPINHLPNDADSNSSYTASNVWMTVHNKLEIMRRWWWSNLWNYSVRHFPGNIEKTTKPQ